MTKEDWGAELAELEKRRRELIDRRGGPEGIDRQWRNGKLLVTERLELLADDGSLRPFAHLRGTATYGDVGGLDSFLPTGQIDATCDVDGRKVVVTAGDFTVRGGSGSGIAGGIQATRNVLPTIERGEIVGLVGESWSGKSPTALDPMERAGRQLRRATPRRRLQVTKSLQLETSPAGQEAAQ